MNSHKISFSKASILPLMLVATLLASCGNTADTSDDNSSTQPVPVDSVNQTSNGGMNSTNNANSTNANVSSTTTSTSDRYDPTGKMDPNGNYNADGTLRTGVVLTPTQERTDAMTGMNGIRATLMAELDQVRAELKKGGMDKEHTDADQAQAADLAQGLERIDRMLADMGGATDATWTDMRTSQLKAAGDVRTWWTAHEIARQDMAKQ